MRTISKKGLAAVAVGSLALGLLIPAGTAQADSAPGTNDVVGVGSDTLQYMLDFGADGDYNGNGGYNVGKAARLDSIDATPDANARAGYLNGSTNGSLLPLNPTVVLRAGQSPVQRPNGSGAGVNALIADTGSPETIDFARSSSAISAAQVSAANATIGNVHVVRLAHENLALATATTTNAPALSKQELFQIYQCNAGFTTWNGSGIGATSSDTILPIIPQLGSGTRKTFLQDIGFTVDSAGNATPALGSCVRTDEENNPYSLYIQGDNPATTTPDTDPYQTGLAANPDAIVPFSGGRLNLYAAGYFVNPNDTFGVPPKSGDEGVLSPQIKLDNTGTPSDTNAAYNDERGLYIMFRQSDLTSSAHFNGLAKNWVETLFDNPSGTPFFNSGSGKALLASAGVTPDYADCGENPTTGATACGPFNS
ncbi:MAG TPA: substrate-binding domain-containing protein [Jatrophihabitantaceae bacterium]|jgi:ABC-type phosphate transport system substrate-binding protein|nr:substrate-binding domain-containing protein [Jatrophihabitantaceae bacterium]